MSCSSSAQRGARVRARSASCSSRWPTTRPGQIVEALLGGSGLSAAIRERITAAAEGNPLFVEQLVSMLVDDGSIQSVDGAWRLADDRQELRCPTQHPGPAGRQARSAGTG